VDAEELARDFPELTIPEEIKRRYNIAPSQEVAVVANNGQNEVEFFQWGLVPSWAKDPAIGNPMINARAESLAEKPSFQRAFRRRRCLILADGFYEWRKEPEGRAKTPMYIRLKSGKPFAFAGLWEIWRPEDGTSLKSCAIITTTPNKLMEQIHNRMPVILPREACEQWLNPEEQPPDKLMGLLNPYPAEEMAAYPVSRFVNDPRNNSPECIMPADKRNFPLVI